MINVWLMDQPIGYIQANPFIYREREREREGKKKTIEPIPLIRLHTGKQTIHARGVKKWGRRDSKEKGEEDRKTVRWWAWRGGE